LEILSLDKTEPHSITSVWKQDIRFTLDFADGRVKGLYPVLEADWNADGRKDLLYVESGGSMALRLGEAGVRGPRYGAIAWPANPSLWGPEERSPQISTATDSKI
jgi:hypothetical protein